MPGFCKHFCLNVSTSHGMHSRYYNQHQQKQRQLSAPAKLCVILKQCTTFQWHVVSVTTSLKALPCEMFRISCFRFVWAALAEFTAHSSSAHFLSSTVQFVWYLLVLSCNQKDSDGNHSLLRLFKRYCGFPGSAQKPEKLQYHIIISKRKHGSARVSYQLV